VRKDVGEIIQRLSALDVELTMTTNATRIHEFLDVMWEAGVRKINVSLDTLNADTFLFLTKRDLFDRVKTNIDLLLAKGFVVKVNVVVMRGVNDREVLDFVRWTLTETLDVRFIEFMPFEGNRWDQEKVVTWQEMLDMVRDEWGKFTTVLRFGTIDSLKIVGGLLAPSLFSHNIGVDLDYEQRKRRQRAGEWRNTRGRIKTAAAHDLSLSDSARRERLGRYG
jgi:sulfatase maturation enzyme AslB (radical SAM superfamily)